MSYLSYKLKERTFTSINNTSKSAGAYYICTPPGWVFVVIWNNIAIWERISATTDIINAMV